MTIVATCPYCRTGGVRAPERAIGASAVCPSCGSSFTVVPNSGLPGWKQAAVDLPPAPAEETRSHAAAVLTEPAPVVVAPEPAPRPTPVRTAPATVPTSPPSELTLPLLALILFGPAVLASQLPYGRAIAVGLALVGLLQAMFALGAEGRAKLLAVAAATLHVALIAVVLLAPAWLGLAPWRELQQPTGATEPKAVRNSDGNATEAEWVDGATASWASGDVRVSIRGAFVGPIELVGPKGATRRTREQYLQLSVRVANTGIARRIALSGWAAGPEFEGVRLTDPTGAEVKMKTFAGGWHPADHETAPAAGLLPSKTLTHVFVFEPPTKKGTYRLELPGRAIGVEPPVRFSLASTFIGVRP